MVEFKSENGNYPKVIASPSTVRKPEEIPSEEILDLNRYVLDGRVVLQKKKIPPFYTTFPSWQIKLRKMERVRQHYDTRIKLRAEYGALRSFLSEKYPEAKPSLFRKKKDNDEVTE